MSTPYACEGCDAKISYDVPAYVGVGADLASCEVCREAQTQQTDMIREGCTHGAQPLH